MRSGVLVFQHSDNCHLGSLGTYLASDGIKPTIIALNEGESIPPLETFEILIVLGGPQDVWEEDKFPWLRQEKIAIREWVRDLDRPCLGICLGHQLLAESLGGKVGLAPKPEVALWDINLNLTARQTKLFAGFGASTLALQWHGAEVTALPPNGCVLASSRDCLIAAMAVGPAAFGVQYHIEATEESVRSWSTTPPSCNLIEQLKGTTSAQGLTLQMAFAAEQLRANSRRFYDNFMDLAGRHALAQTHGV
jgi:GMP synthase-like glutamine amidotransferase